MSETADILKAAELPTAINGLHESLYRSYSVLQWALEMLDQGMPPEFVVELGRAALELPPRVMALGDGMLVEVPHAE